VSDRTGPKYRGNNIHLLPPFRNTPSV
jgi:hypothetical protein